MNLCTFKKILFDDRKRGEESDENKIQRTRWKRSHSWFGKIVIFIIIIF